MVTHDSASATLSLMLSRFAAISGYSRLVLLAETSLSAETHTSISDGYRRSFIGQSPVSVGIEVGT